MPSMPAVYIKMTLVEVFDIVFYGMEIHKVLVRVK